MSYKPKFCCQCGESIERDDWKIWTSRRFCRLCETEFGVYDWAVKVSFAVSLIFAFIGILSFWQKPAKSLEIVANQPSAALSDKDANSARPAAAPPGPPDPGGRNTQISQNLKSENSPGKVSRAYMAKAAESTQGQQAEKVYFCGALTKKGTPCSRKVKGGGRCWQHIGQQAVLTPDKLIITQ